MGDTQDEAPLPGRRTVAATRSIRKGLKLQEQAKKAANKGQRIRKAARLAGERALAVRRAQQGR